MRSRSSNVSPDFIERETKEELRFELAKMQEQLGGEVQYLSIYFDGKNHVAWFFNNLDTMVLNEKLKNINK